MKPAVNTTEDPPAPITEPELQEYINGLRRRIEVQSCLIEDLCNELRLVKKDRESLTDQLDRVLIDLHWYEAKGVAAL